MCTVCVHFVIQGTVHSQHLYARVTNPERSVVPFTLKDRGGDTFAVEFTPAAVGEYRMEVRYQDKPIPGSPFVCKVPTAFCTITKRTTNISSCKHFIRYYYIRTRC